MPLIRRAFTVSSWTLGSRILGLVRDRLLGATFGASAALDAFMFAFALPNLFRNLFGEGALSAAFVPRYVRLRCEDPSAAEVFAGTVLLRLSVLLGVIAGAGMVLGAAAMWTTAERTALVAALALPQLPYLILVCVSAIMAGMLNARGRFAVPAASPVILNCCLIACVLVFGERIALLPWAVLAAGLLQIALHLAALKVSGGVPRPGWRVDGRIRELRRATLPTMAAAGAAQFNAFLDVLIAYVLLAGFPGAVAILYFGNRLLQFPLALVSHAVGTAIYPDLATAAEEGWAATGRRLAPAIALLQRWLLPAAVGLLVVAEPLVRTVYQAGDFDQEAVGRTVLVTRMFAIGMVPLALTRLLIRAFHAHLDQRTPVRVVLIGVVLNLVLNLVLVQTPLREAGLALATAVSGWVTFAVAAGLLVGRGGGAALPGLLAPRAWIGSAAMGVAVFLLLRGWPAGPDSGTADHALRLAAAVGLGVAIYAPLALIRATRLRP